MPDPDMSAERRHPRSGPSDELAMPQINPEQIGARMAAPPGTSAGGGRASLDVLRARAEKAAADSRSLETQRAAWEAALRAAEEEMAGLDDAVAAAATLAADEIRQKLAPLAPAQRSPYENVFSDPSKIEIAENTTVAQLRRMYREAAFVMLTDRTTPIDPRPENVISALRNKFAGPNGRPMANLFGGGMLKDQGGRYVDLSGAEQAFNLELRVLCDGLRGSLAIDKINEDNPDPGTRRSKYLSSVGVRLGDDKDSAPQEALNFDNDKIELVRKLRPIDASDKFSPNNVSVAVKVRLALVDDTVAFPRGFEDLARFKAGANSGGLNFLHSGYPEGLKDELRRVMDERLGKESALVAANFLKTTCEDGYYNPEHFMYGFFEYGKNCQRLMTLSKPVLLGSVRQIEVGTGRYDLPPNLTRLATTPLRIAVKTGETPDPKPSNPFKKKDVMTPDYLLERAAAGKLFDANTILMGESAIILARNVYKKAAEIESAIRGLGKIHAEENKDGAVLKFAQTLIEVINAGLFIIEKTEGTNKNGAVFTEDQVFDLTSDALLKDLIWETTREGSVVSGLSTQDTKIGGVKFLTLIGLEKLVNMINTTQIEGGYSFFGKHESQEERERFMQVIGKPDSILRVAQARIAIGLLPLIRGGKREGDPIDADQSVLLEHVWPDKIGTPVVRVSGIGSLVRWVKPQYDNLTAIYRRVSRAKVDF